MLALLFAVSTVASPAWSDVAAVTPCAPARHSACSSSADRSAGPDIRVGKRCHPDVSKTKSCREVLSDRAARKDAALAAAR